VTRVLLVHSSPAMRAGLRSVLGQGQGIEVVAEASEGEEALHLLRQSQPDVALIARSLSGALDGAAVAERVKVAARGVRVLGLSAPGDDESVYRMWQAGAAGCISERARLKSIAKAVEAATRGERLWTLEQIERLQRWWEDAGFRLEVLTRREVEVLRLVAQFRTNEEIAQALGVTRRRVEGHVSSILPKLGVSSRRDAARWAWEKGLPGLWGIHR
jgi:NarL family two-component system response regulator LiaR